MRLRAGLHGPVEALDAHVDVVVVVAALGRFPDDLEPVVAVVDVDEASALPACQCLSFALAGDAEGGCGDQVALAAAGRWEAVGGAADVDAVALPVV